MQYIIRMDVKEIMPNLYFFQDGTYDADELERYIISVLDGFFDCSSIESVPPYMVDFHDDLEDESEQDMTDG